MLFLIEQKQYMYEIGENRNSYDHADDVSCGVFTPNKVDEYPSNDCQNTSYDKCPVKKRSVIWKLKHVLTD